MSPEIQAMQRDDGANPGMLAVADGEDLWAKAPISGGLACAGCHGEASSTMRGVAARYPAWDARTGRPIDLQSRVNACRREHQGAEALAYESPDLLALTAFVAAQSRGLPIAPPDDPRLEPARAAGRALFETRQGQLGLSCAICHDDHRGHRLGAAMIPQGHPTGYPLLPPRMARSRLAATAPAQLPHRHARRALRVRRAGLCCARTLPRDARRAAAAETRAGVRP